MSARRGCGGAGAWVAAWVLLAAAGAAAAPKEALPEPEPRALEDLLGGPGFWETAPAAFAETGAPYGFRWTSSAQDSARSAYPKLTYLELPVVEAVLWFATNGVREAALSLYNRGDVGVLTRTEFEERLNRAVAQINRAANVRPIAREIRGANRVPKKLMVWNAPALTYTLEWSATSREGQFQGEYVRLTLAPPQKQAALSTGTAAVSAFAMSGKALEKTPEGDVYIKGVPMVDQGPKGYCAVAATERVLRYFGTAVDQHQLAQLANTQQGTSPEALKAALQRISLALRIKFTELEDFSVKDFLKIVDDYNLVARRRDVEPIRLPQWGVIEIGSVFSRMNPEVFKESRLRNAAHVKRFTERVRQQVDKRIPLVWSVMLGLVPEPGLPQVSGGHIRLIIGYNVKTREVLYTDSWGAGHELKRMPLDDAYTITVGLFSIEPR